jgi:hypothetical protein
MSFKLLTAGTLMMCAALLHAQTQPNTGSDAPGREALRQGQVALDPNAQQSPSQTIQQAIAFERYKEMAAEREAQKEASAQTAKEKRTVAATRK